MVQSLHVSLSPERISWKPRITWTPIPYVLKRVPGHDTDAVEFIEALTCSVEFTLEDEITLNLNPPFELKFCEVVFKRYRGGGFVTLLLRGIGSGLCRFGTVYCGHMATSEAFKSLR